MRQFHRLRRSMRSGSRSYLRLQSGLVVAWDERKWPLVSPQETRSRQLATWSITERPVRPVRPRTPRPRDGAKASEAICPRPAFTVEGPFVAFCQKGETLLFRSFFPERKFREPPPHNPVSLLVVGVLSGRRRPVDKAGSDCFARSLFHDELSNAWWRRTYSLNAPARIFVSGTRVLTCGRFLASCA